MVSFNPIIMKVGQLYFYNSCFWKPNEKKKKKLESMSLGWKTAAQREMSVSADLISEGKAGTWLVPTYLPT